MADREQAIKLIAKLTQVYNAKLHILLVDNPVPVEDLGILVRWYIRELLALKWPCEKCDGSGLDFTPGVLYPLSGVLHPLSHKCPDCKGTGQSDMPLLFLKSDIEQAKREERKEISVIMRALESTGQLYVRGFPLVTAMVEKLEQGESLKAGDK